MTRRSAPSRSWRGLVALVALAVTAVASSSAFGWPNSYTIHAGDTVDHLASRWGVTRAAVVSANHLADANRIYAGQTLVVPGASANDTPTAPLAPVATPPSGTPRFPAGLVAAPDRLTMRPYFRHWATVFGVPAGLLEAVAWMESGWQNKVVSSTGAVGIGQIEPKTNTFVSTQLLGFPTAIDARLPDNNIRLSAAYLAWLLRQTRGDVANALGGYYQGLSMLNAKGPLTSTRRYVAGIGALWAQFRSG